MVVKAANLLLLLPVAVARARMTDIKQIVEIIPITNREGASINRAEGKGWNRIVIVL